MYVRLCVTFLMGAARVCACACLCLCARVQRSCSYACARPCLQGFRRCRYAGFGHLDMGRKMVKTQDKIIFRSGKSKYNGC